MIWLVKFGKHIFRVPKKRHKVADVYVQQFKRDGLNMVSISYIFVNGAKQYETIQVEINHNSLVYVDKEKRESWVKQWLALPLNFLAAKWHPLIAVSHGEKDIDEKSWYIIPQRLDDTRVHMACLRHNKYKLIISPIHLIDVNSHFEDRRSPLLISHAVKVTFSPTKGYITIMIKIKTCSDSYKVYIPSTSHGFFEPSNILRDCYTITYMKGCSTSSSHVKIYVDISKAYSQWPEVVIITNLRRGNWLYTQYSIAPLRFTTHVLVDVINSTKHTELYKASGNETVVYVEVFDDFMDRWQYVVVHIRKQNYDPKIKNASLPIAQKVYKRIEMENGFVYYDLDAFDKDTFMNMLSKIPVNNA
ncbi:spherical body protein, putative [Babesia ovis]|uniref:Spherical body protein, putative n=1 Tax=Babesia ovis TaxID=5869 RepID=A0A9W5TC40_BABOV|nr:spherical body protein, putative [Babesia ovis]